MTRPPKLLSIVLLAHGVITLAGAVVLTVFPTAIPAAVGITLERHDYLLVYLVAAAELAVAVLSFGATRLTDRAALRLVVATLVVLHGASGLMNLLYLGQTGFSAVLVANTCARAAAVVVLLAAWRSSVHHTWGMSR
jgi:hypothetical protein